MPMTTNPTAGDVHVNTPLTNFSQKYLQSADTFIANRAAPMLPVSKQSDLFYVFSREDFFRDEAQERADGTESAGGGFGLTTDSYFAKVYAWHKDVSDRQRANADSAVRLDQAAAQYATQKMLIKRDRDFATNFFGTGIWGTDLDGNWLASATPDPIADMRTGIRTVQSNTGMRPNRALFGRRAWDLFLDDDSVLDRVKGGATVDLPARVMKQLVAQTLELESVEVADAVVNTALRGEAESTGFVFDDDAVLIYYAPTSLGLDEPTAMTLFSWTGFMGATNDGMRIKRFRMEANESDRIEAQMAYAMKVVAADLGYFLHGLSTS